MTLADVCVVACAEAWRGDGENPREPMGVIPMLGRQARAGDLRASCSSAMARHI
jgi:hypothetical protein